jgi:hypothetical protein
LWKYQLKFYLEYDEETRMFKSIKVTEEVYSILKALAVEEKKSLSDVIMDMCSTSGRNQKPESCIDSLESKIDELNALICSSGLLKASEQRIKGRGRDSNPRRGLHRAIG